MDTSNRKSVVITSYFNPIKFTTRYRNYIKFRREAKKYNVDLIVVYWEKKIKSGLQVSHKNRVTTIKVYSHAIMFLQYCLINIGIKEALNRNYKYIYWVDADLIFHNIKWVKEANLALNKYKAIQLFENVNRETSDKKEFGPISRKGCGSIFRFKQTGDFVAHNLGFAWGIQSQILEKCKLFDACIVGSGDLANVAGFWYNIKVDNYDSKISSDAPFLREVGMEYIAYHKEWCRNIAPLVKGKIGYIKGDITALYHGNFENRKYMKRHKMVYGLNPREDIVKNKYGCWEWSDNNGMMYKVEEYFKKRCEDN